MNRLKLLFSTALLLPFLILPAKSQNEIDFFANLEAGKQYSFESRKQIIDAAKPGSGNMVTVYPVSGKVKKKGTQKIISLDYGKMDLEGVIKNTETQNYIRDFDQLSGAHIELQIDSMGTLIAFRNMKEIRSFLAKKFIKTLESPSVEAPDENIKLARKSFRKGYVTDEMIQKMYFQDIVNYFSFSGASLDPELEYSYTEEFTNPYTKSNYSMNTVFWIDSLYDGVAKIKSVSYLDDSTRDQMLLDMQDRISQNGEADFTPEQIASTEFLVFGESFFDLVNNYLLTSTTWNEVTFNGNTKTTITQLSLIGVDD